jgi:hypothetical protein
MVPANYSGAGRGAAQCVRGSKVHSIRIFDAAHEDNITLNVELEIEPKASIVAACQL